MSSSPFFLCTDKIDVSLHSYGSDGIASLLGKGAVNKAVNRLDMPKTLRKLVGGSLRRSLSGNKQRKAIEEELIKTMRKEEFTDRLVKDISSSLEQQIVEMARSVEMPIVQ